MLSGLLSFALSRSTSQSCTIFRSTCHLHCMRQIAPARAGLSFKVRKYADFAEVVSHHGPWSGMAAISVSRLLPQRHGQQTTDDEQKKKGPLGPTTIPRAPPRHFDAPNIQCEALKHARTLQPSQKYPGGPYWLEPIAAIWLGRRPRPL